MRPPPYLPFLGGVPDFRPNLKPLDAGRWLVPDTEAGAWLAAKRALMRAQRGDVTAGEPGQAGHEVLALVSEHVGIEPSDAWPSALEAAASLVSDDFCLMRRSASGDWTLASACLCAPTFWSLAAMLGRPLGGLHHDVPASDLDLAARIARVFDGLAPGRILERFNWTVQRGPERFTPVRPRLGMGLYLRVERQTVRKLAGCGDVLFTIRIALDPLESALKDPAHREAFERAWHSAHKDVRRYKAWAAIDADVCALLA